MKYQNDQILHVTRKQLKEWKKQIEEDCMNKLLESNAQIIQAMSEDNLHIINLAWMATLIDEFGFGKKRLTISGNGVADRCDAINRCEMTKEELVEKVAAHGVTLGKESTCAD